MKQNSSKTIFAVGGGKGGVGKSIFSVALGCWLAKEGYSTALVDLDLGGANLHTYMGVTKKTPTIADFILRKVASFEDIMLETTQKNVTLISGAEFIPGMANPAYWMKLKIIRHVRSLPADIIIIDLGAGTHFNTLDFFGMSDRGIVLTAAEPGAILNSYSFIKGALFRNLQQIFKKHADIDGKTDFTDDDVEAIIGFMEGLDDSVFSGSNRKLLKLKMYFKPAEVVAFLTSRGLTHDAFYFKE